MADNTSTRQENNVTPFKGKTLERSAKQQAKPIAQSSSSAQYKRPAASPLEDSSSKKQDNQEKDSYSDKLDSEEDIEFEKGKDQEQEEDDTHSELDENFGRNFTDVAEDVLLIDRLQALVTAIIKAKRTPSPTQSKQLADLTQDVKEHFNRLQAKYLQIQGKYIEQSNTINKLLSRDSRDIEKIRETIKNGVSKIPQVRQVAHMPPVSYASVSKSSKEQELPPKTKVLLVYPKQEKKDQTSEETKLELQTKLKPEQMKLQVNRISKIRNGGVTIEVPLERAEELSQALQQGFWDFGKSPKI